MPRFSQITFDNIKTEIELFLKQTYNKADILFSKASPYGQVLNVTEELFQLSFLYKKNAINQWDMSQTNSTNRKIIRTNALLAGHNPSRAISSTGTLRFRVKGGINISEEIAGGQITLNNRTVIKNNTNGLDYVLDLGGADQVTYNVDQGFQFFVNIKQGKPEFSELTGTGELSQSLSIDIPGIKDVEQFSAQVSINGDKWEIKNHLFEMLPDEQACVIRSGFNGGIDVQFGNGAFGLVPPIGSIIRIDYILTDGSRGNIFRRTPNDWKFVDEAIDGVGVSIDLTQTFDTFIATDINFGADAESIEFTKSLLPIVSNNFVLALPQQYAFQIKKLGVFSHVNAYERNGTLFITVTPNIKLFKNRNNNYFNIDLEAFKLDNFEKSKIDKYLRVGGNIQLTKKYKITSPNLSFYVMNIFIITFDDAVDENVNAQVQEKVSNYFLNLKRMDRIPKRDMINILSEIDEIDSVDVNFTSKKNEDYHKEFVKLDNNRRLAITNAANASIGDISDINLNKPIQNYNPNEIRGLDPILGDIVFESNEIPVIRGGWEDRHGIFYSETPRAGDQFTSLNIIKKGSTPRNN